MSPITRAIAIACCCAVPAVAVAQSDIRPNEWSQGTTMNGFVGVAADRSQSGPALGGAVGWELTPTLAIESNGSWVDFGQGTTAFGGAIKVRMRVAGRRSVDPFIQAGVGLYRASFGTAETQIPTFYSRRMAARPIGAALERTFTDPTLVAGGGVSLFVNRHFALRPDVEATVVLRDGRSHLVTTVALHAVYHFEDHPVTPARRR